MLNNFLLSFSYYFNLFLSNIVLIFLGFYSIFFIVLIFLYFFNKDIFFSIVVVKRVKKLILFYKDIYNKVPLVFLLK